VEKALSVSGVAGRATSTGSEGVKHAWGGRKSLIYGACW
jgi:hypothetical protein